MEEGDKLQQVHKTTGPEAADGKDYVGIQKSRRLSEQLLMLWLFSFEMDAFLVHKLLNENSYSVICRWLIFRWISLDIMINQQEKCMNMEDFCFTICVKNILKETSISVLEVQSGCFVEKIFDKVSKNQNTLKTFLNY